jgi:2-polyprenyl-3-methyl-5-hydroxy-6-metoxy-1,4-benzoquinol methylase
MAVQQAIDQAQAEAFAGKVLGDLAGVTNTALASIGDRLGLFKSLVADGPATSAELAARAGANERYVREWLAALASAGYLTYDPSSARFTLQAEHALVLAEEGGPMFLAGAQQELMGLLATLDTIAGAFRNGGGVAIADFHADTWDGLARVTATWVNNQLVQNWLPLMPEVQARLERGVMLADVGTGYGQAVIRLAQAFPNSRFVGYDINEPSIAHARADGERAGLSDRVRFEQLDAPAGLPGQYDLITTFDVIHDTADPRATLRAIRHALKPDGIYICQEINGSAHLEENAGPLGAMFYGFSVFFCMTQSLAAHGEGLGTYGMPEPKVRELSAEAGFGAVRHVPHVPIEDPFSALYEIRPSAGGI